MFQFRKTVLTLLVVGALSMITVESVQAGPLLDWLRGRACRRCTQQQAFQPGCATPCNTTCQTTCMQTCSRVVVNYVPCTAYRTSWQRVPVTQYRPVTSTDPCTGCSTTCMRPCTTYTWRMQQVPYTTYRPVYRRQTYQVPVTYTNQMQGGCATCATGGVAMMQSGTGCATCATGVQSIPQTMTAPNGTITTGEYYQTAPSTGTPTPADSRPSLDPNDIQGNSSSYRAPMTQGNIAPITDPAPASRWQQNSAPQLLNPFEKTTQSPSIQRWSYSPVRLAAHQTPVESQPARTVVGTIQRSQPRAEAVSASANINAGWHTGR